MRRPELTRMKTHIRRNAGMIKSFEEDSKRHEQRNKVEEVE
jgi:hypothetical protein